MILMLGLKDLTVMHATDSAIATAGLHLGFSSRRANTTVAELRGGKDYSSALFISKRYSLSCLNYIGMVCSPGMFWWPIQGWEEAFQ